MVLYEERRSSIPDAVIWTRAAGRDTVRVLPDGCMDLIWGSDGRLFVAGPDTRAQLYQGQAEVALTGIRFSPGIGPSVLGVPAEALRDQRIPLGDIWPRAQLDPLMDGLAVAADPGAALEALGTMRLRADPPVDHARIREIVRLLRVGRRVADVADAVNLSERQLHRRSLSVFGYGPKTLARVLRLVGALDAVREGSRLADAAAGAGYADQSHLAHEARALAGVPLTTLAVPVMSDSYKTPRRSRATVGP